MVQTHQARHQRTSTCAISRHFSWLLSHMAKKIGTWKWQSSIIIWGKWHKMTIIWDSIFESRPIFRNVFHQFKKTRGFRRTPPFTRSSELGPSAVPRWPIAIRHRVSRHLPRPRLGERRSWYPPGYHAEINTSNAWFLMVSLYIAIRIYDGY